MDSLTRRRCLSYISATPAVAGLGLGGCAPQTDTEPPVRLGENAPASPPELAAASNLRLSEEELLQIHLDVMVGEPNGMPPSETFTFEDREFDKALRNHIRSERVLPAIASGALKATEVPDTESADYVHVSEFASDEIFALTHDVMQSIFDANSFEHALTTGLSSFAPHQSRVIFGLRGCGIVDRAQLAKPLKTISLKETKIDHLNMRCIIGVWDRQNQTVSAHEGSTAPHLSYMQIYRAYLHLKGDIVVNDAAISPEDKIKEEDRSKWLSNWRTNQLGQGLHLMSFGSHAGRPSLLTQHKDWFGPVKRARNDLGYRYSDWDVSSGRVVDNIHPAWSFDGINYASAGCNCIHGGGGRWPYWGQISNFLRELAGASDPQGTFAYAIVTGREARLHAQNPGEPSLRRLRFGSSGQEVLALQESGNLLANVASNGLFDRSMHYAVVEMQQFDGVATDGIVSLDEA